MSTRIGTRVRGEDGRRIVELPRCVLVVVSGQGADRGDEYTIGVDHERYRIGKSGENDLVLQDETASRVHCEIVREPRGYVLRDLGSTNGTLVDGAEVREVFLEAGSIITVGKTELKVRAETERIEVLPSEQPRFGEAVGRSSAMREIFGVLERLAPTNATFLLGGETGTGKDVVARSIHQASARSERPFIVVDCGAVTASLIESELFGHERGAFTGASATRKGAFELAHGGTLFLDEVGELPLDLQPKLLRALEQRTIRRVGGNDEIHVDLRVIAASKRNLRAEISRGKFREDLYFRLAVVPLDLPPLRERREDVPMLAKTLLDRFLEREPDGTPLTMAATVAETLRGHDWPGNVRELRNVLERAAYTARAVGAKELRLGPIYGLGVASAPEGAASTGAAPPELPETFDLEKTFRETKAEHEAAFERRYVAWLLSEHDGNISAAARAAGMDRKHLHKLARRHGVHPESRRS